MSQGKFQNTLIRLEVFKRIFLFCPQIDFVFQGVSPRVLVKNDQSLNLKVGIFHFFMPLGISACRKTPLGIKEVWDPGRGKVPRPQCLVYLAALLPYNMKPFSAV